MKTFLVIGVLAAAQCASEPSGPEVANSPDAGSSKPSEDTDSGLPEPMVDDVRSKLLKTGPAPFTVPTRRIAWPQRRSTVLAPQGARLVGVGESASVVLGEGSNFLFRVTPLELAGEPPEVEPGEDGAMVWQEGTAWRFDVRTETYACTNDLPGAQRHDREDVEMMIASCRSIESAEAP